MSQQINNIGQQAGNYQLVRLLGKGGFADVYLGEHIHLKTQAAVKLLHTRLSPEDIDGFRREAQLIARLIHPHIVRVLDFGVTGNMPYLVMDLAPHGTLRNRHPRGTRVPLYYVTAYVRQIADALYYAHTQRLIHRDIKPENMLIGRNNEILLSDFGIALATQTSSYQSTQNVAGTIPYMAPEQIQAHPRPASDQYSLAIVVYEWLSGNRPFQGTYTEIAIKHTMVPPPPLRGQVPDLPPSVEDVVQRALHKDPHQRFEDVRAFAMALEQASLGQPVSFQVSPTQTYGPPPKGESYTTLPPVSQASPRPGDPATRVLSGQGNYPSASLGPLPNTGPAMKPSTKYYSRRAFMGGFALAALGGGTAFYFFTRSSSPTGPLQVQGSDTGTITYGGKSTPGVTNLKALVTYKGHTNFVWSVAWSPDSKYVVSGSLDGTAQVWSPENGARLLSTRSHIDPARSNDWANSVAWSPNSKQILTGFIDGTAEVLDIVTRNRVSALGQRNGSASAVAWSPDGKQAAIAGTDQTVMIYDMQSGNVLLTYKGHNDYVTALAWSHNGAWIVSCSSDNTAQVWRPGDGHTLLKYTAHTDSVRSVSWSPDDKNIVSGSADGTAQVWTSDAGNTIQTYKKGGSMISVVAWSHRGTRIASSGNDGYSHIWDARTGAVQKSFFTMPIFGLSWSPDDKRLAVGGYNKVVQVLATN